MPDKRARGEHSAGPAPCTMFDFGYFPPNTPLRLELPPRAVRTQPNPWGHSMSRSIFITAALALAVTLPAVSAQAQAPRTFVSAAGSDSNPCSFAAPCRHFQAAVNATSAGGEVDALDPAGYGPIIITQAITIEGQGWSYIAPPASGNGNLDQCRERQRRYTRRIAQWGRHHRQYRWHPVQLWHSLNVSDSAIRNFTGEGIEFQPISLTRQLFVSNTLVSDNGGDGI